MDIKTGTVINDYKIIKQIGAGQLGITFLAQKDIYNPVTGKLVIKDFAIKTINLSRVTEMGLDPDTLVAEAKTLTNLSANPICEMYISCYYEYFRYSEYLLIVSDYIKGPSLQQLILENTKKGFETNNLIQLMFEIAESVDYIHTHSIAHQNIKPSNIIFDVSSNRLRLVDFSFSCSATLNSKCKGKAGTIYYMPPELLQLAADPSTLDFSFRATHDIWSMGVVFYQMANPGRDFMDFKSNNPEIISKDIQIQNVKPSTYKYMPVNSVINAILTKDYTKRPTSGQVVIILRLARPLCVVNGVNFDREEAEALVMSLGINIEPTINDYSLCKKLTDHLNICKIKDGEYQKRHLLQIAQILGISVDQNVESAVLCNMIQEGLQTNQDHYSQYVTNELIRALSYMAWIKVRASERNYEELTDILTNIEQRYSEVYEEAHKLDLVNLKLLESKRQEATLKSLVYDSNASIRYGKVYATLANRLIDLMLEMDPDFQVGGIPLSQLKFN